MHSKHFSYRGFAIIEMLVAVSIITVSIFALLSVSGKSIELSRRALNKVQASFLLEEGAEIVKIIRLSGWENITSLENDVPYYPTLSGSNWILSVTPNTIDSFSRTVVFEEVYRDANDDISESGTIDAGTKKVTVFVSWNEEGETETESLIFYITDIFSE